jgi:hypothetical protein
MGTFRISSKYWNSLTEKEQLFFKFYAASAGVQRCKRIITLANRVFHNWDDIVELSRFKVCTITDNNWAIIQGMKVVGMIYKDREGIETIHILHKGRLTMAWHNSLGEKNPPSTLIADYGTKFELLSVESEKPHILNLTI